MATVGDENENVVVVSIAPPPARYLNTARRLVGHQKEVYQRRFAQLLSRANEGTVDQVARLLERRRGRRETDPMLLPGRRCGTSPDKYARTTRRWWYLSK